MYIYFFGVRHVISFLLLLSMMMMMMMVCLCLYACFAVSFSCVVETAAAVCDALFRKKIGQISIS